MNTNGSIQRDSGGNARGGNAVDLQVTRFVANQVASGSSSFIGGGHRNTASAQYATVLGGDSNEATNFATTIGGGVGNSATADRATVGGGRENQATGDYSTIGGGRGLRARSYAEAVAGVHNTDYTPLSTTSFNAADRLFVLGNGTAHASRADALVVYKNGAVAFGNSASTGLAGNILVSQGASASPQWQPVATALGGTTWLLAGNAITDASIQFMGTTSNHPLALRSNDIERLRLNTNGSIQRDSGGNARGGNAIDLQVARFNSTEVASGLSSVIGGGYGNRATGSAATVGGGGLNQATGSAATVGGGESNLATNNYATVGGGLQNQATNSSATVGGGYLNQATGANSVVGGGYDNQATASHATIAGGYGNRATDQLATVGGGQGNQATNTAATVGGGQGNQATNTAATVGGGLLNQATGQFATVGGGLDNQATGAYATVGGGFGLRARSYAESVAGVYNTDYTPSSTTAFAAADRLFVLGNGTTDAARADALVVYKSGAVAFGAASSAGAAGSILVSQGASASPQWQPVAFALSEGTVLYGPASQQNTKQANGSVRLFDVAYSGTPTGNALGAAITSSASTLPGGNATGLTVSAVANATGTSTGLSISASGGTANTAIDVTGGNVLTSAASSILASGPIEVGNIEVHKRATITLNLVGDETLPTFTTRYLRLNLTNTDDVNYNVSFPAGVDGQRLTVKTAMTSVTGASTITFVGTQVNEVGTDLLITSAEDGLHFISEYIYDIDSSEWVLLSSVRVL